MGTVDRFRACSWMSDFWRSHTETQIDLPVRHAHHISARTGGRMTQARIRQMSLVAVVGVGLVVVLGGTALAQSSNTEVGTWKLNVAKSKFSPGTAVKSGTIKVEAAGAGIKQT